MRTFKDTRPQKRTELQVLHIREMERRFDNRTETDGLFVGNSGIPLRRDRHQIHTRQSEDNLQRIYRHHCTVCSAAPTLGSDSRHNERLLVCTEMRSFEHSCIWRSFSELMLQIPSTFVLQIFLKDIFVLCFMLQSIGHTLFIPW